MKKNITKIVFLLFFVSLLTFCLSQTVLANDSLGLNYANELGLENSDVVDPRIIVVNIVKFLLSFIGLIAVSMIMYAGFLWMTSGGDPGKVGQAKKTLINASIGLAIVVASFVIVLFIQNLITGNANFNQPGAGSGGPLAGGLGASGNRVLESHYPARNQTDVPRNTKIVVTFREPMDQTSLMTGGVVNTNNILIALSSEIGTGPYLNNFNVTATPDNRTFVFTQFGDFMGSPSENLWYSVRLQDVLKTDGSPAFALGQYYEWQFEVGTEMDLTPPRVQSVIPYPDSEEPRNVVVQINFSEGIDPVTGSGAHNPPADIFSNLLVNNLTDSVQLAGYFYVGNQYRTIEFITNEVCGTNSCNETVYCLPGNRNIEVRVNAAALANLTGGITDMAGNSLDGNSDGIADGPESESGRPPFDANMPVPENQGDDYRWDFQTTNEIDLVAPNIIDVNPGINAVNVNTTVRPQAVFDKLLMAASVNKASTLLYANPVSSEVNYWLGVDNDYDLRQGTIVISHEEFYENTQYIPECNSGIRDVYQNCYRPGGTQGGGEGPLCTPDPAGGFPYCCNGVLSATPCSGITPAVCGDNNCDTGECSSGCVSDCDLAWCCGIEGCNAGIGEDTGNCSTDCSGSVPPPPPPPPPPLP